MGAAGRIGWSSGSVSAGRRRRAGRARQPAVASAEHAIAADGQDDGQSAPSRFRLRRHVHGAEYGARRRGAKLGQRHLRLQDGRRHRRPEPDSGLRDRKPVVGRRRCECEPPLRDQRSAALARVSARSGGITAFAIDQTTGMIKAHRRSADGRLHSRARDRRSVWQIRAGGELHRGELERAADPGQRQPRAANRCIAVTGHGANTGRQEAPHPHHTLFDPAGAVRLRAGSRD